MMTGARERVRIIAIAAVAILLIISFVLIAVWEAQHSDFTDSSKWEMAEYVEHGGAYYRRRTDVNAVLLMGVDQFSADVTPGAYNNEQCADFLVLAVFDHAAQRTTLLQISRDTMAEVTILGIGGKKTGTVRQQIALSHTYGTGENDSCRNTVRAVSALFYNLPVEHYVCLTMDAVAIVNDAVGGVTVTVEEDLTALDPAFVPGATVCLSGEQALLYVHGREGLEDSTNASRMGRQKQYIAALAEMAGEIGISAADAAAELADCMHSNYSSSELERAYDTLLSYEHGDILDIKGSYSVGEYMEFTPDEDALKAQLLSLFYKKI